MSLKARKKIALAGDDPDFKVALRVLERAAKRARETACLTNTPLALWVNGKVKTVRPKANGKKA